MNTSAVIEAVQEKKVCKQNGIFTGLSPASMLEFLLVYTLITACCDVGGKKKKTLKAETPLFKR